MPDTLVDRLEVIQVEDEQREAAAVAVRARALALERLVEEPPVPQARQRVGVGKPASLPIPKGVVERGHAAPDDLADGPVDRFGEVESFPRDDCQRAERAELPP